MFAVRVRLFDFFLVVITIITSFIWITTFASDENSKLQPVILDDAVSERWVIQENYSDEFNEASLDLEKWRTDIRNWGKWSWDPDNVTVKDGKLHITMRYEKHRRGRKRFFYKSGIIKSNAPPILYGYFEARIKAAQRYPGVSPAFWASKKTEELWTEIDFVELTQRNHVTRMSINTHVHRHNDLADGSPMRQRRYWDAAFDPRDDFHIYACQWDINEIKWYIDGRLIARIENRFWHQPLDVVFSMGLRKPLTEHPSNKEFPTTFEVDYVRVWQSL